MPFQSARFNGVPRLETVLSNSPAMRYGETGNPVAIIQQALIDAGIPMPDTVTGGAPDGIFLGETKRAIKEFQRRKPNVLTDDGVVGYFTLSKLDELFKSKPIPSKPKPTGPTLPTDPKLRQEEIIRQLVEEAHLPEPKARELSQVLMGIKVGKAGVTLLTIIDVISATGAIAATATVLGALGTVVGGLLMIINSMETGYRIAGHVGMSYGMTAWVFDKRKPEFSAQMEENIKTSFGDYRNIHKFKAAWRESVDQAIKDMSAQAKKFKHEGRTVDVEVFKAFLRWTAKNSPRRFCMNTNIEIEKEISDNHERGRFADTVSGSTPCIYNR